MKHSRRLGAILLGCAIASFFAARWHYAHSGKLLEIARSQVIAFPLFVASLWLLSERLSVVRGFRLPRWLFGLVTVVGFTAVSFAYNNHTRFDKTIYVAPLENDSFATQTRITVGELEEASRRLGGLPIANSFDVVRNIHDAERMVNARVEAVVWGNTRWLNITFGDRPKYSTIGERNSPWLKNLGSLRYVTQVPWVGLSYQPLAPTAEFIASLTSGSETGLRSAAETPALWTSFAHRAYGNLLLGNLLMEEALASDRYQYASFDCAIDAYRKGWARVSQTANGKLKTALLNNLAVASYIQGTAERNKAQRFEAREWLQTASRMPKGMRRAAKDSVAHISFQNFISLRDFALKRKHRNASHD